MFTRLSKILLILLTLAGIGGSIAIGLEFNQPGFIIIGLIVTFLILCIFGMFVEACNNLLDVKNMMKRYFKDSDTGFPTTAAPAKAVSQSAPAQVTAPSEPVVKIKKNEKLCPQCNNLIEKDAMFCTSCGHRFS